MCHGAVVQRRYRGVVEGTLRWVAAQTPRMKDNRVVQGRMVTPERLAELVEGESVIEAEPIEDADRVCPDCGGDVLTVGYMPSALEFVTAWKCQECDWGETDRE
jgi:hypothetical protein